MLGQPQPVAEQGSDEWRHMVVPQAVHGGVAGDGQNSVTLRSASVKTAPGSHERMSVKISCHCNISL